MWGDKLSLKQISDEWTLVGFAPARLPLHIVWHRAGTRPVWPAQGRCLRNLCSSGSASSPRAHTLLVCCCGEVTLFDWPLPECQLRQCCRSPWQPDVEVWLLDAGRWNRRPRLRCVCGGDVARAARLMRKGRRRRCRARVQGSRHPRPVIVGPPPGRRLVLVGGMFVGGRAPVPRLLVAFSTASWLPCPGQHSADLWTSKRCHGGWWLSYRQNA